MHFSFRQLGPCKPHKDIGPLAYNTQHGKHLSVYNETLETNQHENLNMVAEIEMNTREMHCSCANIEHLFRPMYPFFLVFAFL